MRHRLAASFSLLALLVSMSATSRSVRAAEEWEVIFQQNIASEYSETRQDALKQIDTTSVKGLRTIWNFLDKIAPKDPLRYDWFVREGAYEALLNATGDECMAEIERVLDGKGFENAKEAIVYGVIWKVRKAFEKEHGGNDDDKIAEAKWMLRKKRGVEYFALVLPTVKKLDPDQRMLRWIRKAFEDKSPDVRLAAIQGMLVYPDNGSVGLLIGNLEDLEKQKSKAYKEWVFTRYALEVLTGQYYRDSVEDWSRWWELMKDQFSIEKRVEEDVGEEKDGASRGKTQVVNTGGVEVTVQMKIAGDPKGYPLLVLPRLGYEPDYFRPYFHGVEEFCRIYYVQMPQIEDFKGLKRDANTNLVIYPTEILADAVAKVMQESGLEKFAVLGHGPESSTQAIYVAGKFQKLVSHLVVINPYFAGDRYGDVIQNVVRHGRAIKNPEVEHGAQNLQLKQDGKREYEPTDAAEEGGLGRALLNIRYDDPSSPEVGAMQFLYGVSGGTGMLNDRNWSVAKVFDSKQPRLAVLVMVGEQSPWTPAAEVNRVATFFRGSTTVRFKGSAEHMFMTETYRFTKELETWLKRTGVKFESAKGKD